MMQVSLQGLSVEILDSIISFCNDRPSLAALARASKHLYRLTLPHLYRSVSLSFSYDDQLTKHLRSLTTVLLQKPEVAALVQSLTIRPIYSTTYESKDLEDKPEWNTWQEPQDLDRLLRKAIEAQIVSDSQPSEPPSTRTRAKKAGKDPKTTDEVEKWLHLARARENEAPILALLLPNLVNLQALDVPFSREFGVATPENEAEDSRYIEKMFQRVEAGVTKLNGQPCFSKLTDVMLPGVDDKYPDDPVFIALCVGLPNIKRLYGANQGNESDNVDDAEPDNPFDRLEPGSSAVESIQLRHSKLKSSNFLKLTQAPKCLKTLIYEVGNTWAWTPVQFPKLQLALNAQSTSLERLCLSHHVFCPYQDEIDEMTPMTFQKFSALKHFRIAPIYLYGNERLRFGLGEAERGTDAPAVTEEDIASTRMLLSKVLPSQLETFGLLYCSDASTLQRVLLGLQEVLAHKDEQFSRLHEVSIHGRNKANLEAVLDDLSGLPWKEKGVRILVRHEGDEDRQGRCDEQERWDERVPWGWDGEVEWAECMHDSRGVRIEVLYDSENHA